MLLSDLFIAGIDGLPAQARVKLGPGVTGVTPAPAQLERVLEELFYAAGYDPHRAMNARTGCVLFDDGQNAFRLMRDLSNGTAQLAKAQDGAYVPAAEGAADVGAVLRGQLRVPSREAFTALFALGCDDLPSRRLKPAMVALDKVPLQDELEMLRDKRKELGGSHDHEFELDGLQKQRFAFDDIGRKRSQITDRLQAAEAALAQTAKLDDLPADFADMIANFDKVRAKHKDDKDKLTAELQALEERGVPPKPKPLLENVPFLAGALGGLALLVGATFLEGDARLLGLLDIAPFGLAAIQALGFVDDQQANDAHVLRQRRLSERLKKVDAKFERDSATVRDAMKRFDVDSAETLLALISARSNKRRERDQLVDHLGHFDAGEGQALQGVDLPALDARISALEDALASSAVGNEAGAIERRIREIEASLASSPEAVAPVQFPPFLKLLQALSELTGKPVDALTTKLAARTSTIMHDALHFEGALTLQESGEAEWQGRPWSALAMPLQDNLFITGHLAAFEMIAAQTRFPLFLIGLDALPHVLPYSQALPFLQGIGESCQVVLFAHDEASLLGCPSVVSFA